MTYTTTAARFEELTKKVNKVFNKIDRFGANVFHEFYEIRRYVKVVPLYAAAPAGNHKELVKVGDVPVDVVDFEFSLEERVSASSESRVVAVLESVSDSETPKNLVHVIGNIEDDGNFNHYAKVALRCDHCNSKHHRKRCAVVQKADGSEIMVGLSCLKDYFGYDEMSVVSGCMDVDSLICDCSDCGIMDYEYEKCSKYTETIPYLAKCIAEIKKDGYQNSASANPTKLKAAKRTSGYEEYVETAENVVEFFKNYDAEVSFDLNIKTTVTGEFCKVADGFVAYAYVAYLRIIEKESFKKAKKEAEAVSEYVGNVGDKITVTAKCTYAGGYSNEFGYTNIWKFTDSNNNIYIWKTQNDIDGMWDDATGYNNGKVYTLTGKVKEHSEYNGVKQTVLTRCKVVK